MMGHTEETANSKTAERLCLTVDEMARELGVSRPIAYELARRADFPAIRLSKRQIVIPTVALRRWLEDNASKG